MPLKLHYKLLHTYPQEVVTLSLQDPTVVQLNCSQSSTSDVFFTLAAL
jgi:hypothetical protein